MMLTVNRERLWESLMEMAKIGATPRGGCNRQALTDHDREARELFSAWCREAGCELRIDRMGNVFARLEGKENGLPPVISGSHLDTQPSGGRFDGVYGVLATLEVIRTLNDKGLRTRHPLEAVVWTNEEGVRFSPAMIGSGVWCGAFSLDYGHGRQDPQGCTIGEELRRIGYLGSADCKAFDVRAALEVHIEQGPILENEGLEIGVVTGIQGMRWYDLVLQGEACHAGPTPMELRKDPFVPLSRLLRTFYEMAARRAPWGRITFGAINAEPGARNTVAEKVTLSIDLRHPEDSELTAMENEMNAAIEKTCRQSGVIGSLEREWLSPAVEFDRNCVETVQRSAETLGYGYKEMVSGAGHDSAYVARVAPTAMIFIPCAKGLSHNEAEDIKKEHAAAGCDVLLHSILELAG